VLATDVDSLSGDREMRHHRDTSAALGLALGVDPMPVGAEHGVNVIDEDVIGRAHLLHGHDVGGPLRDPWLHSVAFRRPDAVDVDGGDREFPR